MRLQLSLLVLALGGGALAAQPRRPTQFAVAQTFDYIRVTLETEVKKEPLVRLVYDGRAGKVQVWVNGRTSPSIEATETKLGAGKVGLGSFFDLGEFRKVKIKGKPAR